MSVRIKIEIDDAQLDAVLAKLQSSTSGTAGGGTGLSGIGGKAKSGGGGGSVSSKQSNDFRLSDMLFSPPKGGGSLPSVGRGSRTIAGILGGQAGYGAVEFYQKGLWLEQGLTGVTTEMAAAGMYTFIALMILQIKALEADVTRRINEQRRLLMELSDIQNIRTWQAWKDMQEEQYWGRKD